MPGCSTGEEAYSIAMLIAEGAAAVREVLRSQDFCLRHERTPAPGGARRSLPGQYRRGRAPGAPGALLRRAKTTATGSSGSCAKWITFAPQNLLQDPPFSRLDLITCRNLLIYLEPEFQKKVVALFHFALREGGHLFLGPAETVSGHDDLFHPISKRWRIYARVGQTRHDIVDFPLIGPSQVSSELHRTPALPAEPRLRAREHFQRDLLERYAPASVLIDGGFSVHAFQGLDRRVPPAPERRPDDQSARPGAGGLAGAVARGGATGDRREAGGRGQTPASDAAAHCGPSGSPSDRSGSARTDEGMLTVSFFEREPVSEARPPDPVEARRPESELEAELSATREELRFTLEQMETSNAELQASNEEIRSINEEFQASNEELETSKEELQSLNEELRTVNNQLQVKVPGAGKANQRSEQPSEQHRDRDTIPRS